MIAAGIVRWFQEIYQRKPQAAEIVYLEPDIEGPIEGVVIGSLVEITYQSNGMEFRHRYSTRPLLVVSSDGQQTFIVKGRCRFTDRGFIG